MDTYKRQVAVKTSIAELLARTAGATSEAIATSGLQRINLIAAVVGREEGQYPSLMLDDGSGKIAARTFDAPQLIAAAPIGQIALIIGRPRKYNQETYLIPEIIKPILNQKWVDVRLRELAHMELPTIAAPVPIATVAELPQVPQRAMTTERVLETIRQLDVGDGAEIDAVLAQLNAKEADQLIEGLLMRGEIFQVKPGVVKVLE